MEKYWSCDGSSTSDSWETSGSGSSWNDTYGATAGGADKPAANDSVYLYGTVAPTSGPTSALTLGTLDTSNLAADLMGDTSYITIASAGALILGYSGGGYTHDWGGVATAATYTYLGSGAVSHGDLGDNVQFGDLSINSHICGSGAAFHSYSINSASGTVGTGAIFYDGSINEGECGSLATFVGSGIHTGTFTGSVYYVEGSAVDLSDAQFTNGGTVAFKLTALASKFTGPITSNGSTTPKAHTVEIATQTDCISANIKATKTILGVSGNVVAYDSATDVKKTAVVAAANVVKDVARWTGAAGVGYVGTYPTTAQSQAAAPRSPVIMGNM